MKQLYHVLVLPDDNGSYYEEIDETPFDFAPFDTCYGLDFDMALYLDPRIADTFDEVNFVMSAGCAAMLIARKTGLRFTSNPGQAQSATRG